MFKHLYFINTVITPLQIENSLQLVIRYGFIMSMNIKIFTNSTVIFLSLKFLMLISSKDEHQP